MELPIYLDNCATTACDERVVEAMIPYFSRFFGNPASKSHVFGWKANAAVDEATLQLAQLIGARPDEIFFTSGATESCNLVLRGLSDRYGKGHHIITTRVEHKAVLDTCAQLEKQDMDITYLDVDQWGQISLAELEKSIKPTTILIAVMYANNETGVLQPISAIASLAKEKNILFFSDATQAIGKIPVDVKQQQIPILAFSSHKLFGPKGVGALYLSRKNPRISLTPQITGGGQQHHIRSGTLNVPGIVGFGVACKICQTEMGASALRLGKWRHQLETALLSLPFTYLNGHPTERLPQVSNLSFDYLNSNEILSALNASMAVSSGSACTSGSLDPSYVLKAMQRPDHLARASIRFSLGRFTQQQEVDFAIEKVLTTITQLREQSPAWAFREFRNEA